MAEATLPSASFDRFPDEIVSDVFVALSSLLTTFHGKYFLPASLMPVCKRWRTISLHTPALWVYALIDTKRHDHSKGNIYETLFTPFSYRLKLSGALPLHINGIVSSRNGFILLGLLGKECHRWETVFLQFETDGPLIYLPNQAPLLRKMKLIAPKLHWTCRPPRLPIPDAPNLHSVALTYILRPDCIPVLPPIKDLRISDISSVTLTISNIRTMLATSPSLTTLHLRGMVITGSGEALEPLYFEEMEELRLLNMKCEEMALVLDLIDSPNLKRLALEGINQGSLSWETISKLPPRRGEGLRIKLPLLERLAVSKMPNHDDFLSDLSHGAPSLAYLSITGVRNAFKIIRDLTSDTPPALFPRLRVLTSESIPAASLLDLLSIRQRMKNVESLHRLNVHINDMGLPMSTQGLSFGLPPPFTEFEETVKLLQSQARLEVFGTLDWYHREIYGSWDSAMNGKRITNEYASIQTEDFLSDDFALE